MKGQRWRTDAMKIPQSTSLPEAAQAHMKNLYDDSTERMYIPLFLQAGNNPLFSSPCGSRHPGWRHCRSRTPASALMAFASSRSETQDSQCVFDESVQVELGRDETGSHDLRNRGGAEERQVSTQVCPHSAIKVKERRTILGPRPAKRPSGPACFARTTSFFAAEPLPPCPLLIWLRRST